jgi:hypothetical protein
MRVSKQMKTPGLSVEMQCSTLWNECDAKFQASVQTEVSKMDLDLKTARTGFVKTVNIDKTDRF